MKQFSIQALKVIIVISTVALLGVHQFGSVKATSNIAVYVLGVYNPLDPLVLDLQSITSSVTILPSVTSLTSLSTGSILYIDGSWLASASSIDPTIMPTIVQTVVSGLPTVVVRGDPSILANAVPGLMKYSNPGLPLVSEGVHVIATLADGTTAGALFRITSGFDYSVATEFQWATYQLTQTSSSILSPLSPLNTKQPSHPPVTPSLLGSSNAFWQFIVNATTDTHDTFQPYGQVITTFTIFQLQNSGSTSYKWYNIFSNQTMIPGTAIFKNSNYRNYQETAFSQPNDQNNTFVSNGPASQFSAGSTTVNYNIGTLNSTQSMSYFLKNTNINNTSSSPDVSWLTTMTGGTAVGKLTLQVIPGWTDRVVQSQPLNLQGLVAVTFATFSNGMPTNTAQTSVGFGISS